MMSIDEQQMRAIAFLAARCRPTGAKPWDEPGIVANLRKVAHVSAPEVILATIRAAANRAADSPGVIPNVSGEHWREKVTERTAVLAPKKADQCARCGGLKGNCACMREHLAADYEPTEEPPVTTSPTTAHVAAVRAAIRGTA